jgi:hypothetical protein
MRLEELLEETIGALATLDAERCEELARLAATTGPVETPAEPGPVAWPPTAPEWRRAAASHWVLGHLVGATARQLAVQRRIAGAGAALYRLERDARLAARLNAVLAWPWGPGGHKRPACGPERGSQRGPGDRPQEESHG